MPDLVLMLGHEVKYVRVEEQAAILDQDRLQVVSLGGEEAEKGLWKGCLKFPGKGSQSFWGVFKGKM